MGIQVRPLFAIVLLGTVLSSWAQTPSDLEKAGDEDLFSLFSNIPVKKALDENFELFKNKKDESILNQIEAMPNENIIGKILALQEAEEMAGAVLGYSVKSENDNVNKNNMENDDKNEKAVLELMSMMSMNEGAAVTGEDGEDNEDEAVLASVIRERLSNDEENDEPVVPWQGGEEASSFREKLMENLPMLAANDEATLTEEDLMMVKRAEGALGSMLEDAFRTQTTGGEMENGVGLGDILGGSITDKGVVDFGGEEKKSWRSGRRLGLGWRGRGQQLFRKDTTEDSESDDKDKQQRRGLRSRKRQQISEGERPRRIANTVVRAGRGLKTTAELTADNVKKTAELSAGGALMTASLLNDGLGDVMLGINDIDFEPINDVASKTAEYLMDMAKRNVPTEIVSDLLTTREGNAVDTVKAVIAKSGNPEDVLPIVEDLGTNYIKVMKKVKDEMDSLLKVLFRN